MGPSTDGFILVADFCPRWPSKDFLLNWHQFAVGGEDGGAVLVSYPLHSNYHLLSVAGGWWLLELPVKSRRSKEESTNGQSSLKLVATEGK